MNGAAPSRPKTRPVLPINVLRPPIGDEALFRQKSAAAARAIRASTGYTATINREIELINAVAAKPAAPAVMP